ncbi:zinc metalloprotease [Desulfogranum mediterraneum]|uniref:hypothetical protein n=1 Tax=Desulfogranum mediterraneum TaxID=160661 RepID=UPI0004106BD5|nr:hypothetical protein [Desulfogranum mediterraneum]
MESLEKLIQDLTQEAAQIQIQGRSLRPDEMARLQAIHQALPHLRQAADILRIEVVTSLITYKIVSDVGGRLKQAGRTACNFWNRFIAPASSIVIRLGVFTANNNTIARAYKPYTRTGVIYGVVEFNTSYLSSFSGNEIAGTIIHEIGHTLGFGWEQWQELFDPASGRFTTAAIDRLPALETMRVETDHGPGTRFSHWDEQSHDRELMTGFKDHSEHVLPITISVMELLGHQVMEELPRETDLNTLMESLALVIFSRQGEAKTLDRDHFQATDLWENIPHDRPLPKKRSS